MIAFSKHALASKYPSLWSDITRLKIMHSWITCCGVSMLPEKYSRSVFTVPARVTD